MLHITAQLRALWTFVRQDPAFTNALLKAGATVVGALLTWLILRRILKSAEKRVQRIAFFNSNPRLFGLIRLAAFYVLFLVAGNIIINLFYLHIVDEIFYAACLLLIAVPVKRFADILINYLEKEVASKTETKADNIVFSLLNKLSGVIIYTTAVILALDTLGINIVPFVAGAGVAGLAIGFAAKDTLSNMIAGVLLIVDRPFEIGDRIEVWSAPAGSSTWGDVLDIGLRATRIRTTDNIVVTIPNNEIMNRDIVNYTILSTRIRVRINIGIAYSADIRQAKDTLVAVAREIPWVSASPAPKVVVRNFGESAIGLQLRVWIDDARKRMDTISEITDRVKTAFDRRGIEIPYPKREIIIQRRQDTAGQRQEPDIKIKP